MDLRAADLRGARLDDADLRGVDLWAANIANASLRRCDLRGARLTQASFAGSDLRAAKLAGADLHMTDLEGAHLACVDTGRPRKGDWVKWAQHYGWPSFADAMRHYRTSLHLRGGEALLAIDAAADVSDDVMGEVERLTRTAPRLSVAATACIRLGARHLAEYFAERVRFCREFEERTVAAAAIVLGAPQSSLAIPKNALGGRSCFLRGVDRVLENLKLWPRNDEAPPPYRGSW